MDSIYTNDWINSILDAEESDPAPIRGAENWQPTSLSSDLIELVVNVCDELSLSSEVEFTCLDNFDVYCRTRYDRLLQQIALVANVDSANSSATASTSSGGIGTACDRIDGIFRSEIDRLVRDLPILLVAMLMLSAKMIGNHSEARGPLRQMRLRTVVGLLRAVRPTLTESDMKTAEHEVFATLQFHVRPSLMFRSVDCLLDHSEPLAEMPYIRSKALILLRILYMTRNRIRELYEQSATVMDVALVMDLWSQRQRRLCLASAVVMAAFVLAEQSIERCGALARRLSGAVRLPLRQLTQMAECVVHVVEHDARHEYVWHSSSPPPPNSMEASFLLTETAPTPRILRLGGMAGRNQMNSDGGDDDVFGD